MKKMETLLLLILTIYFGAACNKKESGQVKISVHATGLKNLKVQAFTSDMLSMEPVVISESVLDSSGNAVLEFKSDHPVLGFVKIGDLEASAFSAPGDEFKIILDSLQKPQGIRYEGDEADVNDYIVKCWAVRLRLDKVNDKYYFQLEQDEFLTVKDSLQANYERLYTLLKEKTTLDPELDKVLEIQQKMNITYFVHNYVRSKYGSQNEIPESIKSIIDKVPDDSLALKYKMSAYSLVVNAFLESRIYTPLFREYKGLSPDSINGMMPALAVGKIEKSDYPEFLKEFLFAKNVNNYLIFNGITPEVNSIYLKFKKTYEDEDYLSALKKSYDKWLAIGPGKPAPDFSADTPDGKKISLSDLKGKVVYMDVWATWCGPCKTELPFSRKIQKDFEGNDQVTFLYVSIDESIPDWHNMLKKDKDFVGIHVNQQQHQQPGAIWESYLMTGIPRYVLIDADGKIVQSNASRPSSGKVTGEIKMLLTRKR
ncbi:TlpA family protein disulfide reductase [Dyadobacter frigoris]|uniref:TlpA family protein disulfide reductase n=1 Tax=Dyadobacter frigoris TaxID=2576211 RepID=A0A4U6CX61_9BACT|nr:TlpA disulfide reductase family protein [Dyadobacter frigoris]TKT89410.1 TlpA family protein disulfide reductase [Dyadobacter frigoris]